MRLLLDLKIGDILKRTPKMQKKVLNISNIFLFEKNQLLNYCVNIWG